MPELRERERSFVAAFMGPARGNATQAAKIAGYSAPRQAGSRMLSIAAIQRAITTRQVAAEKKGVADATERDLLLSTIARDVKADVHARIAAIKELNKCSGRHSIRHVLDASETLADIIAASRAKT